MIHAHTLEVLEQLGVSERLVNTGLKLAKFTLRDRDRVLVRLHFDTLPTRCNYLVMLPQDVTEKILAEGLAEAGGAVRWGSTVESLTETLEGVKASVVSREGKQTIHARYVIGADGMHKSGAANCRDRVHGRHLRGIIRPCRRGDDLGPGP